MYYNSETSLVAIHQPLHELLFCETSLYLNFSYSISWLIIDILLGYFVDLLVAGHNKDKQTHYILKQASYY